MRVDAVRVALASLEMASPMRTAVHETTHTHNVLVEIEAEGVKGQGAALTLHRGQAAAAQAIVEDVADGLIGKDATAIRRHRRDIERRLILTGATGVGKLALSALDVALWDLLGKSASMPLFRLLGGERRALPVYVQGGWLSMSPRRSSTKRWRSLKPAFASTRCARARRTGGATLSG